MVADLDLHCLPKSTCGTLGIIKGFNYKEFHNCKCILVMGLILLTFNQQHTVKLSAFCFI